MSAYTLQAGQYYVTTAAPTFGWTVIGTRLQETEGQRLLCAWLIRNDQRTAMPELLPVRDVVSKVESGEWVEASAPVKPIVDIDRMPADKRANVLAKEESRYKLIESLIHLGEQLLWAHGRSRFICERAAETNHSHTYLYQLLCLYWQLGGRCGLRPRASLSGQKSLSARFAAAETAAPLFHSYKTGKKQSGAAIPSKALSHEDVKLIRLGARKFLFCRSPDGKLRLKYKKAYINTLITCFKAEPHSIGNTPIPSYGQFVRTVKSDPEFHKLCARVVGPITAIRSHRKKKDTTQNQAVGPGHRLQIDDCDAKVILVSELDRQPIGSGRFFFGACQWSGVGVGLHDTLGASDYEGIRELLVSVATRKADYLRDHDLHDIDATFFPGHGVFAEVVADNGPLRSRLGDLLPQEFCSLATLPVYRGDLKSDVESSFGAYLRQVASNLPGYTRIDRYAGLQKSNAVACLTRTEFRKLLWAWLAAYNTRVRQGFLPVECMQGSSGVERPHNSPYALFNYGIKHISGNLRVLPPDTVRRLLMRRAECTLTPRHGIYFRGLHYFIDEESPFRFESAKVELRYSEHYIRSVYVYLDGKCYTGRLRQDEQEQFGNLSFPEVDSELEKRAFSNQLAAKTNLKEHIKLQKTANELIKNAHEATREMYASPAHKRTAMSASTAGERRLRDEAIEKMELAQKDRAALPPSLPKAPEVKKEDGPILRKKSLRDLCS